MRPPPKFGLCQLIRPLCTIVSSFYEPQFDIYLCIPLSSTPSTQANNPSLIAKYLVRQETDMPTHASLYPPHNRLTLKWECTPPPNLIFDYYPSANPFDCCFVSGVFFEDCCVIVCLF